MHKRLTAKNKSGNDTDIKPTDRKGEHIPSNKFYTSVLRILSIKKIPSLLKAATISTSLILALICFQNLIQIMHHDQLNNTIKNGIAEDSAVAIINKKCVLRPKKIDKLKIKQKQSQLELVIKFTCSYVMKETQQDDLRK